MLMELTLELREQIAEALGIDVNTLPDPNRVPNRQVAESKSFTNSDLTDEEFEVLRPALPPEPRQRNAISNRMVIDALLWLQATGKRLTQLPERYGTSEAVRKRSERWAVNGAWEQLIVGIGNLELSEPRRTAIKRIGEQEAKRGKRIRKSRLGR